MGWHIGMYGMFKKAGIYVFHYGNELSEVNKSSKKIGSLYDTLQKYKSKTNKKKLQTHLQFNNRRNVGI